MKNKLPLILWLFGTIFPFNWLRQESAIVREYFDALFSLEWIHIIGHLLIFCTLTILFLRTYTRVLNMRSVMGVLILVLIVGGLQEFLQLPAKGRTFSTPEVFDLCVDLVGGILGVFFFLAYKLKRYSTYPGQRQAKNVASQRTEDGHQDNVANRFFIA